MFNSAKAALQKMSPTHLHQTYLWLQDEALRNQVDCLSAPSEEQNRRYWENSWANPARLDYAILDENGRHIGNCGLCTIDRHRRKCELWIYLGSYKGKGFGSSAVTKLISIAFEELGMERLYIRILASNTLAAKFYEKLGFVYEGRWRSDSIVGHSRIDSLWYSMLRYEKGGAERN